MCTKRESVEYLPHSIDLHAVQRHWCKKNVARVKNTTSHVPSQQPSGEMVCGLCDTMYMNKFCPVVPSFLEAEHKSYWVEALRSLMAAGRTKNPVVLPRVPWWNEPSAKGERWRGWDKDNTKWLNSTKGIYFPWLNGGASEQFIKSLLIVFSTTTTINHGWKKINISQKTFTGPSEMESMIKKKKVQPIPAVIWREASTSWTVH